MQTSKTKPNAHNLRSKRDAHPPLVTMNSPMDGTLPKRLRAPIICTTHARTNAKQIQGHADETRQSPRTPVRIQRDVLGGHEHWETSHVTCQNYTQHHTSTPCTLINKTDKLNSCLAGGNLTKTGAICYFEPTAVLCPASFCTIPQDRRFTTSNRPPPPKLTLPRVTPVLTKPDQQIPPQQIWS